MTTTTLITPKICRPRQSVPRLIIPPKVILTPSPWWPEKCKTSFSSKWRSARTTPWCHRFSSKRKTRPGKYSLFFVVKMLKVSSFVPKSVKSLICSISFRCIAYLLVTLNLALWLTNVSLRLAWSYSLFFYHFYMLIFSYSDDQAKPER